MLKSVLGRLAAVPLCGWFAAPPELAEFAAREATPAEAKSRVERAPARRVVAIDGEVRCFGLSPMQ